MNQTKPMKRINFLVSKRCNLHCRMCDYRISSHNLKELPLDVIKSMLDEATLLGYNQLDLSGGEPMLRKDIYDIIYYAHSLNMRVMMMTNGVLIGEREAERLAESGLNAIVISLEGFKDVNDKIRGTGNFDKAITAIKILLKWKHKLDIIKVGITISKYNYQILYTFTEFLFKEIGINSISFNPFSSGMLIEENYKAVKNEFVLNENEIIVLTAELEKILDFAKTTDGQFPDRGYIHKIPEYFQNNSMVPSRGCKVPQMGFCVDTTGNIFACWGNNKKMGNVTENSLRNIILSEKYLNYCDMAENGRCKGCLSACNMDAHKY